MMLIFSLETTNVCGAIDTDFALNFFVSNYFALKHFAVNAVQVIRLV